MRMKTKKFRPVLKDDPEVRMLRYYEEYPIEIERSIAAHKAFDRK